MFLIIENRIKIVGINEFQKMIKFEKSNLDTCNKIFS